MTAITIQPAELADFTLPYPWHIREDNSVAYQEFWKGKYDYLIGFQDSPDVQHVTLFADEFQKDPESAVGKYAVFADSEGNMFNISVPIASVRRTEADVPRVRELRP